MKRSAPPSPRPGSGRSKKRQREGYERHPVRKGELEVWSDEQALITTLSDERLDEVRIALLFALEL